LDDNVNNISERKQLVGDNKNQTDKRKSTKEKHKTEELTPENIIAELATIK
jgi:hypothetical protein